MVARHEMVKRPRANGAASIFPCPTSLKLGRTEVTVSEDDQTNQTGGGDTPPHTMREPCRDCGGLDGVIRTRNGQDTVWCAQCNRYAYNAPRTETGRPRRSLRTNRKISPSQRARILLRDGCTCFMCGRRDNLVIAHIVSLRDGYADGLSDKLLYCDANLITKCQECNAGVGDASISPYRMLMIASLRAHHARSRR
jgi:5-methylcytosine-specific restriction endonuclease McrA